VRFAPIATGTFHAQATLYLDDDPDPQATVAFTGQAGAGGGGGCNSGADGAGGAAVLAAIALLARRRRSAPGAARAAIGKL